MRALRFRRLSQPPCHLWLRFGIRASSNWLNLPLFAAGGVSLVAGLIWRRTGREVVRGAVTQPWDANVAIRPLAPRAGLREDCVDVARRSRRAERLDLRTRDSGHDGGSCGSGEVSAVLVVPPARDQVDSAVALTAAE
jgi:hypothetical protein